VIFLPNPPFPLHTFLTCVAITGHWLDKNFHLQRHLLAFTPLEGRHTGNLLATKVYQTLDDYNIKEKFFCLTADNASNNTTMARHLSDLLSKDDIDWDAKANFIPCFAHIINLVVQKFIRTVIVDTQDPSDADDCDDLEIDFDDDFDMLSFSAIISKLREIAKSIRGSTRRWELFQQACTSCKLPEKTIPLDVTVRWNSTFRMLQHSVHLKRAIRRYVDNLGLTYEDFVMSEPEWQQAEVLLLFLLPFQRCTARFECHDSSPEIDYVFFGYDTLFNHIDDVKKKLRSARGLGALQCASSMLKAIEQMEKVLKKYYKKTSNPTVYGDAMILSPRAKLSIFDEESWEDISAEQYSGACRKRFMDQYNTQGVVPPNRDSIVQPKRVREDADYHQHLVERTTKRRKNDYDRYIEIPNDPDIESCLAWWRDRGGAFPDLSKMARDVLPVPASGCAVERQFSISGRMAIWQRNRLSTKTISDAMMYKGALAKSASPMGTQPAMCDDVDALPVEEKYGEIPDEWTHNWWLEKLEGISAEPETLAMFAISDGEDSDE
jgi:hypothetical protein